MSVLATFLLLVGVVDGGSVAALPPDPDAPTVGASLDKSEAHVGDRLTLTVSAVAKAGVAVTLPNKLELGKLELLDRDDGDRNGRDLGDGRRSHRFTLGVASYEVGELEVPAIELSYINPRGEVRTIRTEPVPLRIATLVSSDEPKPEVQPLRPPRSALVEDRRVMRLLRWTASVALVIIVGALMVWFLRRRLRAHRAVEPIANSEPVRPADEVAMERLRALRAAGRTTTTGFCPADGNYRVFYFEVAEVVRQYLGARYRFDSLELTTTELLYELSSRAPHLTESTSDLVRFLEATDLVKFAKVPVGDEDALAVLDGAQALVLSTAAPLEEAVRSSGGAVLLPRENTGG